MSISVLVRVDNYAIVCVGDSVRWYSSAINSAITVLAFTSIMSVKSTSVVMIF